VGFFFCTAAITAAANAFVVSRYATSPFALKEFIFVNIPYSWDGRRKTFSID
jgi:hypothetical protein